MWGHGVYQALHKVQPTGLSEGLRTVGDAVVYHQGTKYSLQAFLENWAQLGTRWCTLPCTIYSLQTFYRIRAG